MRIRPLTLIVLQLCAACAFVRSAASAPRATAGAARGELIVKFRRSATRAVAALQRVGRTRVVDERLLTEQVRVVRLADGSKKKNGRREPISTQWCDSRPASPMHAVNSPCGSITSP